MKLEKSFSLLETIVAIAILLVGLLGAMNLSQLGLASISVFKNQLIAANLAQEGVELVRNKRDSNYLRVLENDTPADPSDDCVIGDGCNPNDDGPGPLPGGGNIYMGITNETGYGGIVICNNPIGCRATWSALGDITNDDVTFISCAGDGATCLQLTQEPTTGLYYYGPGTSSLFTRTIIVTPVAVSDPLTWPGDPSPERIDMKVESRVTWRDRFSGTRPVTVISYLTPHLNR
ncbi:MAG: hypothetical protein AAB372_04410 [Patescibacteria group bacterium]